MLDVSSIVIVMSSGVCCVLLCVHTLVRWSSCVSPCNTIPYNTIRYDMICCTYHIVYIHDFMTIDFNELFMTYAYPSINLSARLWFYGIFEQYSFFYLSSSHWVNWVDFIWFRYKMWEHNAQKDGIKTKWWKLKQAIASSYAIEDGNKDFPPEDNIGIRTVSSQK